MARATFAERPNAHPLFRKSARAPQRCALLALSCALWAGCSSNINDILAESESGDPEIVRDAVLALGDLLRQKEEAGYPYDARGDQKAIEFLQRLAKTSGDPVIRACAISCLGRLERPDSMPMYLAALDDPSASWLVRLEAAKAIAAKPDPRAAPTLAREIEEEPRVEVRVEILKALQVVGGDVALKAVLRVFLDPSTRFRSVKLTAYDAVRALSGKSFEMVDNEGWRSYYKERFPQDASREPPPLLPLPEAKVPDTPR